MVGGFDTDNPPLHSFERDAAGRFISYGDYKGSLLELAVEMSPEPSPVKVDFPARGEKVYAIVYAPQISDGLSQLYSAEEGRLEVTAVGFEGWRAYLKGTFSGTFHSKEGKPLTITDGQFSVRDIPKLEE